MKSLLASIVVLGLTSVTGCSDPTPIPGDPCKTDGECGEMLQCSAAEKCAEASTLYTVKATWTINGGTPSGANCSTIKTMSVNFSSSDAATSFGFGPVPCTVGLFSLPKVPSNVNLFKIDVEMTDGTKKSPMSFIGAGGDVSVDIK